MKKICLLLVLLLTLSGCKTLDNDIESNVEILLGDKSDLANVYFDGYSYYVPNGLMFITKNDYNAIFRDTYNNQYYLYVDVISYYNDIDVTYKTDKSLFKSILIKDDLNNGILNIEKVDGGYFVEFVLNYSKVEVFATRETLNEVIINSTYLLKTIKYNDLVLDSLVGDNVLNYQGEAYNIFEDNEDKEGFIDYVEEYGTYEDTEGVLPDSDNVDLEGDN